MLANIVLFCTSVPAKQGAGTRSLDEASYRRGWPSLPPLQTNCKHGQPAAVAALPRARIPRPEFAAIKLERKVGAGRVLK